MTPAASTPEPAVATPKRPTRGKASAKKTPAGKKSAPASAKKSSKNCKSATPRSAGAGVLRDSAADVAPEAQPQHMDPHATQLQQQAEPSDSDIRIRAYFIAERRAQMSIPGDPALDWIEAREQLIAEAQQGRP
jgi:hypothetical protein